MGTIKLDKDSCNYLDVTRFVGIYLVVFAHFDFYPEMMILRDFAFSFHMPLFFIVSGILHKIQGFSWRGVLQLVLALLVPYLIYNALEAVYLLANGLAMGALLHKVKSTLLGESPIAATSWFFLTLFWVKFFALFLQNRKSLVGFGLVCVAFIFVTDFFELRFAHDNIFTLRSTLLAFPFFAIGYLLKDMVSLDLPVYKKGLVVLILLTVNLIFLFNFGTIDIIVLKYSNLLIMYAMATAGSFAIIYFSQLVAPWVRFGFVKDISRGTMMIVGLHLFVMYSIFPSIFSGATSLKYIILLSGLMMLGFYIIIKLTYTRLPILYGKWRG